MRILAVDPGGTTGFVHYERADDSESFIPHQMDDRNEFMWSVDESFAGLNVVVCEDFRITGQTAKKSPQADALKIIGALDYLCFKHEVQFVLQTPADAKRFATDSRLKKAGMWTPGRKHANDAARHLFLWLCRKGLLNAIEVDNRAEG